MERAAGRCESYLQTKSWKKLSSRHHLKEETWCLAQDRDKLRFAGGWKRYPHAFARLYSGWLLVAMVGCRYQAGCILGMTQGAVLLFWATFFFWSEFPCQCRNCEIMSLRTYSCSSRKAKAKLFFKAKSTAALQKGCKEVSRSVPAILRCSSVFRLGKKTPILNFHFHRAESGTTCYFFRVISLSFFSLEIEVKPFIK